ncbi:LOW QUALITY PROTEIN: pseudouridylate synthase PUS7L-like [Mustela lutreola]|uniref:LOW QUALITY PROTEIN: pseudouridylate synthase PUS7L-like n=1 Tax=Mustela lutreola TaxID=9666 RepID=UPI00279783BF|nr:LOW QUALITY PROTEIN: pseudouridylate synthase PUS7L-like [Mustela lutreola]
MNEVRVSTLESESSKPQMSLILAIQSSYSQGLPGSSRGFQEDGFVEGEAENKTARTRAIGDICIVPRNSLTWTGEGRNQEVNTFTGCSDDDHNDQSPSEKEDSINDGTSKGEEEKVDVLGNLLDEKTNELLYHFACDIKEKWNSKTELIGLSPEFSLGRILDKNQRAILHSAVREKFPFLITVTKNSEIVVIPNLEFKELCYLVSEEAALDFLKYLDAKKANSKFTFKPDTNKDHRKAVHRFVNKKFGNPVETKSFPELSYNASNPNVVITVRFREKTHKHRKRSLFECRDQKVIYTVSTPRVEP